MLSKNEMSCRMRYQTALLESKEIHDKKIFKKNNGSFLGYCCFCYRDRLIYRLADILAQNLPFFNTKGILDNADIRDDFFCLVIAVFCLKKKVKSSICNTWPVYPFL